MYLHPKKYQTEVVNEDDGDAYDVAVEVAAVAVIVVGVAVVKFAVDHRLCY